MDLLPSADQNHILDTARTLLAAEAHPDRLREHGAIGNPDKHLWPKLGELGFIGLALDEADGGIGLSSAEEALIFREFGRNLVSPAVLALVLGARIAAKAGDAALRDEILAGTSVIGLANPRWAITASPDAISGTFHLFDASDAAWITVIGPDGAGLLPRSAFTDVAQVDATDSTLILERATLTDARPALWVAEADHPIYDRALLLLAAYAVGLGEAARDMAVDYAKMREQFGKPIGSFQAIKHICAVMAVRSEAAHCQTSFASLVFADDLPDRTFHAVASKIVATDTAVKNAADSIQVHGAFGFTAEANAHHYLKRSHVVDLLCGDLREQRARLLDLPTPA